VHSGEGINAELQEVLRTNDKFHKMSKDLRFANLVRNKGIEAV